MISTSLIHEEAAMKGAVVAVAVVVEETVENAASVVIVVNVLNVATVGIVVNVAIATPVDPEKILAVVVDSKITEEDAVVVM